MEMMEKNGLQKRRTKLQLDRVKFAAKRRVAQMTEEEQLALAVKMSEQEASHMNSQQEEEEELLRKAIAASLNSCYTSGSKEQSTSRSQKAAQMEDEVDSEVLVCADVCSDLPLSEPGSQSPSTKVASDGQVAVAKSPVVLLQRLSQEIVDSSSIVLSPEKDNVYARLKEESISPSLSDSSDFVCTSPYRRISLSPIFPCRSPNQWQLVPRKLFAGSGTGLQGTSEQLDQCPDAVGSGKQESSADRLTQDSRGLRFKESHAAPAEKCMPEETEQGGSVHYYWGVPFCPKGVDPSQYTKVIQCQLEVYQKNLKHAQRQLLQKKEYGEPVLPHTSALRISEQAKGDEKDVEDQGVTEEVEQEEEDIKEEVGSAVRQPSINSSESDRSPVQDLEAEEESSAPAEGVTSCGLQSSQALFVEETPEVENRDHPVQIIQSTTWLKAEVDEQASPASTGSPAEDEEVTVCPETQPSPSNSIEAESMKIVPVGNSLLALAGSAITSADEDEINKEYAAVQYVQCPLCGQDFPSVKIEVHAAFCDGLAKMEENQHFSVLTRRQKEMKTKVPNGPDVAAASLHVGKSEKCYVCKSLVLLREYQSHVDNCLQTAVLETEGSRRLRSAKEVGRSEGRLLSMLEQSEPKCADAEVKSSAPELGTQRLFASDVEDDHEAAECSHHACSPTPDFQLSDSPIKAFVAISEVTDCLVDFKKQFSRRPNSRYLSQAGQRRRKRRT
ncbi:BRCA1-A complex subunit RAP80 isoform X2 [Microcaecilia unicolor]|uniref:BRCA1-A complex subunit RAP80 n=1 Tax=Microcaecilia unicolor TaxID=1415580 RepID=A0A6P7YS88_9AMPH|nr:BRCA1-A complex subunit RAP80 isoform X2 [Microcaecilia unicolor]